MVLVSEGGRQGRKEGERDRGKGQVGRAGKERKEG